MLCFTRRDGRRRTLAPINRREFLIAGASAAAPLAAWAIVETARTPRPWTSALPAANPTPSNPGRDRGSRPHSDPERLDLAAAGAHRHATRQWWERRDQGRYVRSRCAHSADPRPDDARGRWPGCDHPPVDGRRRAIQNDDPSGQTAIQDLTISNEGIDGSAGGVILEDLYNTMIGRCRFEAIGVGIDFLARRAFTSIRCARAGSIAPTRVRRKPLVCG